MTILGIGLEQGTLNSLSALADRGFQTIETTSFEEAGKVVDNTDVYAVLVDSHATQKIREDINRLLAETPVTTKIVLVTHPKDMISCEQFKALGVNTIDSKITSDDLVQLLL